MMGPRFGSAEIEKGHKEGAGGKKGRDRQTGEGRKGGRKRQNTVLLADLHQSKGVFKDLESSKDRR